MLTMAGGVRVPLIFVRAGELTPCGSATQRVDGRCGSAYADLTCIDGWDAP